MNQQSPLFPIHHMLLNFGDVVRNVVDNVHVQVVWCGAEHFGEGLKKIQKKQLRKADAVKVVVPGAFTLASEVFRPPDLL